MNTDFLLYQALIIGLSGILIIRTVIQYLKGKKSLREMIVALMIWGGFATLSLFPNLSQVIAELFGFALGINFLLVISTLLLLFISLSLLRKGDKLESDLTKLVRKIALEEIKESSEKSTSVNK